MVNLSRAKEKVRRMQYTHRDYDAAVAELIRAVADKYRDRIKAVYAGGSYGRGDFVPGRSDVDLYFVGVEDYDKEELERLLKNVALEIEEKSLKELQPVLDEVLSVTVTTLQEITEGKSFLGSGFNYSNFIHDGRLLWGEDVKELIPKPTSDQQKENAKRTLEQLCGSIATLEPALDELMKSDPEQLPIHTKELLTRRAFHSIFRTAAIFLACRGLYVSKKEDITSAFGQSLEDKGLFEILASTLLLWNIWGKRELSDKETEKLFGNALEFQRGLLL